jgi:hypothetical protein
MKRRAAGARGPSAHDRRDSSSPTLARSAERGMPGCGLVGATLVLVLVWGFGGAENHGVLRAVVSGLFATSIAEILTFTAARQIAASKIRSANAASEADAAEPGIVPAPGPGE